ncbi:MAG: polysaccharide deacetylase family protein [Acidobacteriota bacterium]
MPPQKQVIDSSPAGKAVDPPQRLHPQAVLPELPHAWRDSIRRVQLGDGRKLIALTFDLCERQGERAGYEAGIVECLRGNHAKATFFASGKWMQSHPDQTIRLMADPLFEIGTHGWAHENFRLLSGKQAEERFLWSQAQYELLREELESRCRLGEMSANMQSVPPLPRVFRFPFGTCNAASLAMLAENGVAAIQWDVVSGDPAKGRTARGITETVLNEARAGSIVIFHANGRGHGTGEALPGLISALRSRGFEFVTVSELLQAGSPVASTDCYELKPGDNLRYDRFK